jgi:hypothetical protein
MAHIPTTATTQFQLAAESAYNRASMRRMTCNTIEAST